MWMSFHIFVTLMLLISRGHCGGKILLLGGITDEANEFAEVLSPDKVQSTGNCPIQSIPNYRSISVSLKVGSSSVLLACGGHPASDKCWMYRQSWTIGPTLPQPLRGGSMSSEGENAYYIGGRNTRFRRKNTIYKYNMNIGQWVDAGVSLTTARTYHCSVILQDHLYVLGGADSHYKILKTMEKFNIVSMDSLVAASSPPDLNVARRSHGCAVFEDGGVQKIIAAGGYQVESVEVWWPDKISWDKVGKLPQWRFAFTLTALPQLLVIAGGESLNGRTQNSTLTSSNNGNFWMTGPKLQNKRSYHSAVIVKQTDTWC